MVAAHLLDAHALAPDANDAGAILDRARSALTMAGRRAASLAANEEALRHFERAAGLTDDPIERGGLLEQAGDVAWRAGKSDMSLPLYDEAVEIYTDAGAGDDAARASARTGLVLWTIGQPEEALRRMREAEAVLTERGVEGAQGDVAVLLAELARLLFFKGDLGEAMDRANRALEIAEAVPRHETISQALNTKSLIFSAEGRIEEALALLHHSLRVALEHDLAAAAARAYINLSHTNHELTRLEEALAVQTRGLANARRVGTRWAEWWMLGHLTHTYVELGDWDAAERVAAEIPDPDEYGDAGFPAADAGRSLIDIHLARGEVAEAKAISARGWGPRRGEGDMQV